MFQSCSMSSNDLFLQIVGISKYGLNSTLTKLSGTIKKSLSLSIFVP